MYSRQFFPMASGSLFDLARTSPKIRQLYPSTAPCTGKPNGFNLSNPSACQHSLGPGIYSFFYANADAFSLLLLVDLTPLGGVAILYAELQDHTLNAMYAKGCVAFLLFNPYAFRRRFKVTIDISTSWYFERKPMIASYLKPDMK